MKYALTTCTLNCLLSLALFVCAHSPQRTALTNCLLMIIFSEGDKVLCLRGENNPHRQILDHIWLKIGNDPHILSRTYIEHPSSHKHCISLGYFFIDIRDPHPSFSSAFTHALCSAICTYNAVLPDLLPRVILSSANPTPLFLASA